MKITWLIAVSLFTAVAASPARASLDAANAELAALEEQIGSAGARFAALTRTQRRALTDDEHVRFSDAMRAQIPVEQRMRYDLEAVPWDLGRQHLSGRTGGLECIITVEVGRRNQKLDDDKTNSEVQVEIAVEKELWPGGSRTPVTAQVFGTIAKTIQPEYAQTLVRYYSVSQTPGKMEFVEAMNLTYTRRAVFEFDGQGRLTKVEIENFLAGFRTSGHSCVVSPL